MKIEDVGRIPGPLGSRLSPFQRSSDPMSLRAPPVAADPVFIFVDHQLPLNRRGRLCAPSPRGLPWTFHSIIHRDFFCDDFRRPGTRPTSTYWHMVRFLFISRASHTVTIILLSPLPTIPLATFPGNFVRGLGGRPSSFFLFFFNYAEVEHMKVKFGKLVFLLRIIFRPKNITLNKNIEEKH